jgi:uncharacterized RDD family membrane protein YckC
MFTIIGGDGREYGPATVEQIRGWMAAGRANLDTKAKAAGSDEWRRLGDFPEFMAPTEPPPIGQVADYPADVRLADRLSRLGAWFLDNVLAFICCLPGFMIIGSSVVVGLLTGHGDIGDAASAGHVFLGFMVMAAGGLVLLIVQVWLLSTRGQTVGKRLLNIRIVRLDGSNPGFLYAVVVRAFVPGLIGALPYLGMIFTLVDACFIFRDDRRCVHDLMAGTRVIQA